MARPKKSRSDARSVRFNLRFTPEEWPGIAAQVDASGLSGNEFCRQAVLGVRIEAATDAISAPPLAARARTPDGIEHVVALNRVGVNLNQIARNLNAGLGLVPAELDACLARVNELLDDWQGVAS